MGRRAGAETVARLLQLYTTRGEWGQVELAERLGVATKAVRETMVVLAAAGLPVERIELSGREIAWRLGPITIGSTVEPARPAPLRVAAARIRGAVERMHADGVEPSLATPPSRMEARSMKTDAWVWLGLTLKIGIRAARLGYALASHADPTGRVLSARAIARRATNGVARDVDLARAELEAAGLLVRDGTTWYLTPWEAKAKPRDQAVARSPRARRLKGLPR